METAANFSTAKEKKQILLQTENMSLFAGEQELLSDVSLTVSAGEIVTIIGPNGAGKTTAIRIVCSLVEKSSGNIEVFGYNLATHPELVKMHIGMVPQEVNFNTFDTPLNILVNQAGFYGIKRNIALQRAKKYLGELKLWDKKDDISRTLSGGMKRRLMIARALIHEPELLILDEPTAGVSPIVMDELFDHILKVKQTNVAILMVEQNAKQALSISDRGYVLVTGENRYSGTGKELLNDPRVRSSFLGG